MVHHSVWINPNKQEQTQVLEKMEAYVFETMKVLANIMLWHSFRARPFFMIDDDQEIFYSSMKTGSSGVDDPNPSFRTDLPGPYDRFRPSFDAEEGATSTMFD